MFALGAARWLKRHNIHYARMMALLIFLTMLVSSAAIGLPSAFIRPLSEEFGWSVEEISSALALYAAGAACMVAAVAVFLIRKTRDTPPPLGRGALKLE